MIADPEARRLARLADAKRAELVQADLGNELDRRREAVIASVTSRLAMNEVLDPQFAVQKWIELHAIQALKRSMRQRVAAGHGVDISATAPVESP